MKKEMEKINLYLVYKHRTRHAPPPSLSLSTTYCSTRSGVLAITAMQAAATADTLFSRSRLG